MTWLVGDAVAVRVNPEELGRIRDRVLRSGDRSTGEDLHGAVTDAGFALAIADLTDPEIEKTDAQERMVIYRCRVRSLPTEPAAVLARLESAWVRFGAFKHEAHSIATDEHVASLEFVTWWERGAFYTGRIEVMLEPARRGQSTA
jgi:hypothetical protein